MAFVRPQTPDSLKKGMTHSLMAAVSILVFAALGHCAQDLSTDPDEVVLHDAGVGRDDKSLAKFFRERTGTDADLLRIDSLVRQLGDDSFDKREEASGKLVALGLTAIPAVRRLLPAADQEINGRAAACIAKMQQGWRPGLNLAAVRLLLRRHPADTVETLVRYVPYEADVEVQEEIWFGLDSLTKAEGRVPKPLASALTDAVPIRRALAACIVGHRGAEGQRKAVRDLLKDVYGTVRLRAAQGLLAAKDAAGLPVLVALLEETPADEAWQAEELLHYAAGETAPQEVIGAATAKSRKACRTAWTAWLKENLEKLDLSKIDQESRRPGLVLIWDEGARLQKKINGRVWVCGCDGKVRWQLDGMLPTCAQMLAGGRLLLASGGPYDYTTPGRSKDSGLYRGVNEWDLEGHAVWRCPQFGSPCQRLPTGNTFLGQGLAIAEATPEGKIITTQAQLTAGDSLQSFYNLLPDRFFALRLFKQETAVVEIQEFDSRTGRPLRSIPVPEKINMAYQVMPVPGGQYLIMPNMRPPFLLSADGNVSPANDFSRLGYNGRLHNGNFIADYRVTRPPYGQVVWAREIDPTGRVLWESAAASWAGEEQVHVRDCYGLVRLGFDEPRPADLDLATSVSYRIKQLKDKSKWVRVGAGEILTSLGPKSAPAAPALIEALNDEDKQVQEAAGGAILRIGLPALPLLIHALKNEPPIVRAQVAWFLRSEPFVNETKIVGPALLHAMKDENAKVREMATSAIGSVNPLPDGALAELLAALKDKDPEMQWSAASALGRGRPQTPAAASALLEGLKAKDKSLRISAAFALGQFGAAERVVPALIALLKEKEETTREVAAEALGCIGPAAKESIPALQEALNDPNEEVRKSVDSALKSIKR